jgi:hypothetical protein
VLTGVSARDASRAGHESKQKWSDDRLRSVAEAVVVGIRLAMDMARKPMKPVSRTVALFVVRGVALGVA